MSLLKSVTKGKIELPQFVLIYGLDGAGKSSFAAGAPNPIFLGSEEGSFNLDVSRFPSIKNFQDAQSAISELTKERHDYKTLVIDSLDWLEPHCWNEICRQAGAKTIEDAFGGYGKGYAAANKLWGEFIGAIKTLRLEREMNVILIAHSHVKAFNDPSQPQSYDRYQLKLNDKAAALFREAVDAVLFATFETFVKKDGQSKTKAYGDGKRVVYTERRPSFDAKNRLGLPFEIDLSWASFVQAQSVAKPDVIKILKQDIEDLILSCEKKEKQEIMMKAFKDAGDDHQKLSEVLNRVRVTLTK